MKILQVRFTNLNSLLGSQFIDFATGPLANAGIFAITGPTGAGKSTILDAITLALFGRAARYRSKPSPPDMISRGTGEAHAEVTFSVNDSKIYRASWHLAKARKRADGVIQSAKRFIFDENDKEIASGTRPCDDLIVSLTGLTPDRFFRSAMLAQGEFAKFLQADERERAELLESLTNTEIYTKISEVCYRRHEQAKQTLALQQSRIESISILSDSDVEALRASIQNERNNLHNVKQHLATLIQRVQLLEQKSALEERQRLLNQEMIEHQNRSTQFEPNLHRIQTHKRASLKLADVNMLRVLEQQKLAAVEKLQTEKLEELIAAKNYASTTSAVLEWCRSTIQTLEAEESSLEEKRFAIQYRANVLELWLSMHENQRVLFHELPEVTKSYSHVKSLEHELKSSEDNVVRIEKELAQAKTKHERAIQESESAEHDLLVNQQQLESRRALLVELLNGTSIESLQASRDLAVKNIECISQAKESFEEVARLEGEINAISPKIEELAAKTAKLVESMDLTKSQLSIAKQLEESLRMNQLQAAKIKSFEEHRLQLKEHEPCPLCGAVEHPYVHGENELPSIDEIELKLNESCANVNRLAGELAEYHQKINGISLDSRTFLVKRDSLSERKSELLKQIELACIQLQLEMLIPSELDVCLGVQRTQLSSCQNILDQVSVATKELSELESLQRILAERDASRKVILAENVFAVELLQTQLQDSRNNNERLKREHKECCNEFMSTASEWMQNISENDTCETVLAQLNQFAQTYRERHEEHTTRVGMLNELHKHLETLKQKKTKVSELLKDIESKSNRLVLELSPAAIETELVTDFDRANRLHQEKFELWQTSCSQLHHTEEHVESLTRQISVARESLQQHAVDLGFHSADDLCQSLMPLEVFESLEIERTEITSQIQNCYTRISATVSELQEITSRIAGPQDTLQADRLMIGDLENSRDQLATSLGMLEQQLAADVQAKTEVARQSADNVALEKDLETKRILNELIGSADGKKFRAYTQSLMMGYLLGNANRHLRKFNDRYELTKGLDGPLQIDVLDLHQAGMRRPLASLSGGESFLVSLALALGLSDLSGSNVQIDSLFIDEGFGTLDSASLDMAISALETLHGENKTIGVISHAEMLRERITTQVRVHKRRNGVSEIEVVG